MRSKVMGRWLSSSAAALFLALAAGAGAEEKQDGKPGGNPPDADGVRRDPAGVKGISPFWEALKKGDDAYIIRDYDAALTAYREALSKEPQNALGHYRLGFVFLAKDDKKEAETTWQTAKRFVTQGHKGSSPVVDQATLKAKILFVLADLAERERNFDEALKRWSAYEAHAKAHPSAKTFPDNATERKRRIEVWQKLVVDYGEVKKRIEERSKEMEQKKK